MWREGLERAGNAPRFRRDQGESGGACSPGSESAPAREWRVIPSGPKQRPTCWRSGCTLRRTASRRRSPARPDRDAMPPACRQSSPRAGTPGRRTGGAGVREPLYRERDDGMVVRVVHGARRRDRATFSRTRRPRTDSARALGAGVRDQHLLFQLHPLGAARLADVALDADRHAGLEHAVVAGDLRVLGIVDRRILITHADAVRDRGIAVGQEALG